jgi:C4-dicarboxylate-specific signal transduction histidine kinase
MVWFADIAGYKADQARLAEAEREGHRAFRTSAVSVLTAAIAHEVKNPLAAVVTNAEGALRWLHRAQPELAEADAAILALIKDALRARDVVDRTRLLLARQVTRPAALDARSAVDDTLRLVEHDLRAAGAVLQIQTPPGLHSVLADPLQLQQILTSPSRASHSLGSGHINARDQQALPA